MIYQAPIVGMHFRAPALKIIHELSIGQELLAQRQFDNPYDENAIKVLLESFDPIKELLENELIPAAIPDEFPAVKGQWNLSTLSLPFFLGFIAAKTGEARFLSSYMKEHNVEAIHGNFQLSLGGAPIMQFNLIIPEVQPLKEETKKEPFDDEIPF